MIYENVIRMSVQFYRYALFKKLEMILRKS
jgi:hypothetical protein